jgi:excisionase family DNA binding protein
MSASLISELVQLEEERAERDARILALVEQLTDPRPPFTIAGFAAECSCSEDTVRSAVTDGRLRFIDLGDRTIRIPATELAGRFIAEQPARSGRHLGVAS